MANSVDPDQTAAWSGSTLFAQTCLAENLETFGILLGFYLFESIH